jgi:ankyrin repeat protein
MHKITSFLLLTSFLLFLPGALRASEVDDLCLAAGKGDKAQVKALLAKNPALVKARNGTVGYTALMCAAQAGQDEMISLLLARGADINEKSFDGLTALILAAQYNHRETAEQLLKNKAQIHAKDKNGKTAFRYATEDDLKEMIKLLLKYGARE